MGEAVGLGCIPSGCSGVLTIDLGALQRNYRALADRSRPAATAAVVKADAYGLGVDQVGPALQAAGCRDFFVAQFGEAVHLRRLLANDARVYVLNGLQPGEEAAAADLAVIPVLNSLEQLSLWSALAKQRAVMLPALLQVDTGMSRLGLSRQEVDALAADRGLCDGVDLRFLMSHLACGDEHAHGQNAEQLAVLRQVAALFPDLPLCFANSGGIFLGTDFHGNLARPGIALYGGTPSDAPGAAMQPVVRLDVRVVQTRSVPAGARVGYGATYVASTEMRLATIAAGYADGLPRSLSSKGAAYYDGIRLPIVGRVSMDSLTLDIGALPPSALRLGSLVEIIGPHQSLEMIAADAGTISYEILTSLGRRYHRHYIV
ncbi:MULTISPECIES: alanine racemase [unclassified Beijerinckia]|uniref:alanine racemase n=1 Tax=unclassified Beijerinckia TaxID=2638183 RepID=UPI00089D13B5|nr:MULTISPECIES: alanine racemase [unclassified Beijerinckia]MDH7798356.1 alanine racemase [Beijerinckia sp. GAS462]SED18195.1 alanine racemase [Beijerinckia sp. 28-YEA-48]